MSTDPKTGATEPDLGTDQFFEWVEGWPIIPDDTKCYEYREVWEKAYRAGMKAGLTRAAEIAASNTHLIANAILTERDRSEK